LGPIFINKKVNPSTSSQTVEVEKRQEENNKPTEEEVVPPPTESESSTTPVAATPSAPVPTFFNKPKPTSTITNNSAQIPFRDKEVTEEKTEEATEEKRTTLDSEAFKIFNEVVVNKNYKYGLSTDIEVKEAKESGKGKENEKYLDCSGAVCKYLEYKGIKRGDPAFNNSAAHLHNATFPTTREKAIDGDLITFETEGKAIDHIGIIIKDAKTGELYIAEMSRTYGTSSVIPIQERLDSLKKKYPKMKVHYRTIGTN
jgi:hypothetical protein